MAQPVECLELGEEQIVKVSGSIDFTSSFLLIGALSSAIARGKRTIVDLSDVQSLDSQAMHALVTGKCEAKTAGVEFTLAGASQNLRRMLHTVGLGAPMGLPEVIPDEDADEFRGDRAMLQRQNWQIVESVAFAEWDLMESLRNLAVSAACSAGLDEASVLGVRMAVTEALANALWHGSPDGAGNRIRVQCLYCPHAFTVEVSDEGDGVDARALDAARSPADQNHLGLRLILSAMDEVDFISDDSGGKVRMLKWIRNYAGENQQ